MDTAVTNKKLENMFSVIQHSYKIERHLDFFVWMQNSIAEMIPHDLFLAAWGDFSAADTGNKINYDVASNIKGINTKSLWKVSKEVDACMASLHALWVKNNRHWYALNHLDEIVGRCNFKAIFPKYLKGVHSLLVYGVSDLRGKNECLYIYMGSQHVFEMNCTAIATLMPHVDTALRKIQHLEQPSTHVEDGMPELTQREMEVIDWIKSGKTNQEIGMILNISQNTVKSHLKRIFQKLNVSKRAQAIALLANPGSTKFVNQMESYN